MRVFLLALTLLSGRPLAADAQRVQFFLSFPEPEAHRYSVQLVTEGWSRDTMVFRMPAWSPGYYQLLHYGRDVAEVRGEGVRVRRLDSASWEVTGTKTKKFSLSYVVQTKRQFVANSYLDTARAYIVPANSFLYAEGALNVPVTVGVNAGRWPHIATGLVRDARRSDRFYAANFDVLYDSPLLIGNLDSLPSFTVKGSNHRFIGWKMGAFDRADLMIRLKKMIEAATDLFGDVPYREYTFIGIGPGREHQSLVAASYQTWKEGPFGTMGEEQGKTISYYDKGPLVGLLFDLAIREASGSRRSLDDVMRHLYRKYYQEEGRGFTEAEFREACEAAAGRSMAAEFEYVYTARELDYNRYLGYVGLRVEREGDRWKIVREPAPDARQQTIYRSWMGGQ